MLPARNYKAQNNWKENKFQYNQESHSNLCLVVSFDVWELFLCTEIYFSFMFPQGQISGRDGISTQQHFSETTVRFWISPFLLVMESHTQPVDTNDFTCLQHSLWLSEKPSLLSHYLQPCWTTSLTR